MLTMKQVHYMTGKAESTLRRYFVRKEFEPYIKKCGKRKVYDEDIIDFIKTFKLKRKVYEHRVCKQHNSEQHACGSICWKCEKSDRSGCSWAKALIPVKGWKVKNVKLKEPRKPSLPPPVIVIECPEFKKEERKNDSEK